MKFPKLLLGCVLMICACGGEQNYYGVKFVNKLSYCMSETRLYDKDGFIAGAGNLNPSPSENCSIGKTYYGLTKAVPDEVVLKWKDSNGNRKIVTIVLKGKVPNHLFQQTIILTIEGENSVKVSLQKDGEQR